MTSTPPQQYCLRWNNYQNNLTNVFDQLLQSEAFVDVTLACEGHSLKAHKVVLSACSPYFQSLFFDNPCKHPIVILNGIKWDELKSVVEFMYRGEINVSQEQLAPLLKVAEVLKIRGLADVSRGGATTTSSTIGPISHHHHETLSGGEKTAGRNLGEFMPNSNHDSGSESPSHANGHVLGSHLHPNIMHPLANISGSNSSAVASLSPAQAHQMLATLSRRKRRKMSTPERTPSPSDDMDDHSNQLEIDSTNGDYDHSPPLSAANLMNESSNNLASVSMSLNPTPSNTPSHMGGPNSNGGNLGSLGGSPSTSSLGSIGPALLNLHAAAAAAAAVANAGSSGSCMSGPGNQPPTSVGGSSSVSNDLDIKPGIVEMIREEERAKMLESAHGWLGPSNATLSGSNVANYNKDSYQYQIQNLWQKCWNQNQTGMMHALRFRERGPLKSWRPETMAEAIFAVLREGLSLSQAARKYDIPYPTFVLYANRVHNMLGPSADGSSNTDLMSDMRPKGRGRPQRILLGSWPEEHIRGVIRAVVFRDTQSKDDMPPFVFNRDGGLCLSQTPGSGSHNGLDMSLHQQFIGGNPFLGTPSTSQSQGQSNSTSSSSQPGTSQAINLINLSDSGNAAQHLQIQMSHGTSRSSSTSSSPLQQALSSNSLSGVGAQAQSQLLALQQRHLQQQLQLQQQQQQHQRRSSSSESPSPLGLLNKKLSHHHHHHLYSVGSVGGGGKESSKDCEGDKEILQIKAELAPFDDVDEDEVLDEDDTVGETIPDHDDVDDDGLDEMDHHRHQNEGSGSCVPSNLVKNLSQSASATTNSSSSGSAGQDLSCNNNKSPNNSTNNNNNNNDCAGVVVGGGGSNPIDDDDLEHGQQSQRDRTNSSSSNPNDQVVSVLQIHERGGDVNTPSPKNPIEHQTTTSS